MIVGLLTDGVHISGFPLLKKLFSTDDKVLMEAFDKQFLSTAETELLKPTKNYAKGLLSIIENNAEKDRLWKCGAAVLQAGATGAVRAVLLGGLGAVLQKNAHTPTLWFETLQFRAGLDDERAYQTFTMGLGGILVVKKENADGLLAVLRKAGLQACVLGETVEKEGIFWQGERKRRVK